MPRPRLGNLPLSLRLTPSVDEALDAVVRCSSYVPPKGCTTLTTAGCVAAIGWFADQRGIELAGWPASEWSEGLSIDAPTRKLCLAAVDSATTEVRDVTRTFACPPSARELVRALADVAAMPRYQTRIRYDVNGGLEVAQRRTSPPPTLVYWAACVEWLAELASV